MGGLISFLCSCFNKTSSNVDDQAGPSKPVAAPIAKPEPYSPLRAAELFTNYADADEPNVIGSEGLEKICTEADIPMDGALPILLSWQLNAQEMGKLEKSGWLKWTADRKISSLSAIKIALEELNALVVDGKPPIKKPVKRTDEPYDRTEYCLFAENPKDAFHKLYFYSFTLVKPPQSRNIEMDTAKAFWTVLLTPKYALMNEVLEFINGREESYKAVNKDLWGMMLEFCETMNPNLDGYEADGAWPTLLDEFVAHKKGENKSD
ncbi:Cullin binding-domain-containing protein [Mucidula mucida]|nr:Cullin binding-domain-containing protein [Mucidula mucida]